MEAETENRGTVGPTLRRTSRDPVLWGILLLAFFLRTYHLGYPYWDSFASRQTFNLMVVRDFVGHGPRVLRPQVQWIVGNSPDDLSYFLGEFPLIHALAAFVLRILPLGDWVARIVIISFSLAGLYWLYDFAIRTQGKMYARFAAAGWAVLPSSIFFGRAFMSDLPALALSLGASCNFAAWLETRQSSRFYMTGLLGMLALLAKPTVIGFGLPLLFLATLEFRGQTFKQRSLYFLALMMLSPTLLSFQHVHRLALAGGPAVIGPDLIGHSLGLWLQGSTWSEQAGRLSGLVLGPLGLALAGLGLFWPTERPREYVFHTWLLGTLLVLLMIPSAFVGWNDYYLCLLLPACAGLIGRGLGGLFSVERQQSKALFLAALMSFWSLYIAHDLFLSDGLHFRLGTLISRLTDPKDLIATSSGNAADLLYFAGRRGWEARAQDPKRLVTLASMGARVYAVGDPQAAIESHDLQAFLDRQYVRLSSEDPNWIIWFLGPSGPLRHDVPPGEIQIPYPANFGNQIQLLGLSLREVLEWPTCFEVRYYWRCLRKPDANLRVFVHFTAADGKIAFQQDHWPVAGHFPTWQWNVDDVVEERYVVITPVSVPGGKYQMRVGWFDPQTGGRLPIINPAAADRENRAPVADLEVRRPPRYRWFSVDY